MGHLPFGEGAPSFCPNPTGVIFSDAIAFKDRLLSLDLDDFYGDSPSDAQDAVSFNWAIRAIARRVCLFDPKITLTLTADVGTYDLRSLSVLSRKVVRPYYVVINGNMLLDASRRGYGMLTLGELDILNPAWRTAASGTPSRAAYHGTTLYLDSKPNAAVVSGGSNYVGGTYLPVALTASDLSVELPLPEELHEAVCYFAAYHTSTPMASEQEAWKRLGVYAQEWQSVVEEIRRENIAQLQSWGTGITSPNADYIWVGGW